MNIIQKRWTQHRSDLKNKHHHSLHFQRAWDKYGESAFLFEIIKEVLEQELLTEEQKLLDKLRPWRAKIGYNFSRFASGGDNLSNHPNRVEINKRKSETNKRKATLLTEEERKERWGHPMENNPNWKGGKTYFLCPVCQKKVKKHNQKQETCAKCRDRTGIKNPFYGRKHTEEHILRAKQKKKDFYNALSEDEKAKRAKSKPARALCIDGKNYPSLSAASRALGITPAAISYRLKSSKYPNEYYL